MLVLNLDRLVPFVRNTAKRFSEALFLLHERRGLLGELVSIILDFLLSLLGFLELRSLSADADSFNLTFCLFSNRIQWFGRPHI